jgi:hypothetical protein
MGTLYGREKAVIVNDLFFSGIRDLDGVGPCSTWFIPGGGLEHKSSVGKERRGGS